MGDGQIELLRQPEQILYGLRQPSHDRTQARDIPTLSRRFYAICGGKVGDVLPFCVVSRDYRQSSGTFTLFVGGTEASDGLEREVLPAGIYARLEVRPKLGILWGPAVGEAKRWFYTQWLPQSPYEAVNLEYELHTDKTVGKHPSAGLLFALREKQSQ